MSDTDAQVPLPDLNAADTSAASDIAYHEDENAARIAADLEAVKNERWRANRAD